VPSGTRVCEARGGAHRSRRSSNLCVRGDDSALGSLRARLRRRRHRLRRLRRLERALRRRRRVEYLVSVVGRLLAGPVAPSHLGHPNAEPLRARLVLRQGLDPRQVARAHEDKVVALPRRIGLARRTLAKRTSRRPIELHLETRRAALEADGAAGAA